MTDQTNRSVAYLACYFAAGVASWAFGLAACLSYLWIRTGRLNDVRFLVIWSFVAYGVSVPVLLLPCLAALRSWRPSSGWTVCVALGALLGVIPTAAIIVYWGGGVRDFSSGGARLFYVVFGAAGATFGWIYVWCHKRYPPPSPRGFHPLIEVGDKNGNTTN